MVFETLFTLGIYYYKLLQISARGGITMRSVSFLSVFGYAVALLASAPAYADISDIRAADRAAVDLEIGGATMKYGETTAGTTFDTESGTLTSFGLGGTVLAPVKDYIFSDLYIHLDLQGAFGSTHYNGELLNIFGNAVPHQSTTNNQILHASSKIGVMFPLGDNASIIPYGEIGDRSWWRDLTGIGAFGRTYQFVEAKGGLLAQVSPLPHLVFSLSSDIGSTLGPNMSTQGVTFNLGSEPVWQLGGRVGYTITPHLEVIGDVKFDGFGFGKIPATYGAVVFGGNEMDSYTHQLTFMAGLAYHLFPD
jgi:hypothetical protein